MTPDRLRLDLRDADNLILRGIPRDRASSAPSAILSATIAPTRGGPMSANDQAQLDWLGPEIALVREAIAAD